MTFTYIGVFNSERVDVQNDVLDFDGVSIPESGVPVRMYIGNETPDTIGYTHAIWEVKLGDGTRAHKVLFSVDRDLEVVMVEMLAMNRPDLTGNAKKFYAVFYGTGYPSRPKNQPDLVHHFTKTKLDAIGIDWNPCCQDCTLERATEEDLRAHGLTHVRDLKVVSDGIVTMKIGLVEPINFIEVPVSVEPANFDGFIASIKGDHGNADD